MQRILLVAVLLMGSFLYGCGGGSSSSTPVTYQKTPAMAVFVSGSVVDAANQANGVAATLTVTGATVYSQSGSALPATFSTQGTGLVTFTLPQVPASDLTVTLTAKAPGYITNSSTLVLKSGTATGQVYQFLIPLVSTTGSASIVGVSKAAVSGSNVTVLQVTAGVPATGSTNVTIPAGAISQLSGNLTLTATNYNPQEVSALALAPNNNTTFITSGFTDVSVRDSSGTAATKLDKPMTIRMDIAAGTINPDTGTALQKDDVVVVYTYKPASGTWEKDTSILNPTAEVTVLQDDKGLYVQFTADHFSYWNLGYRGVVCTTTINLTSANGKDHLAGLSFKATATGSPAIATFYAGIKPANESIVIAQNVPKTYFITYYAYYGSDLVHPVGTAGPIQNCLPNPTPMTILLPVSLITYTWTVYQQCLYGPLTDRKGLSNVTVYSCPAGTTVFKPYPVCTIVAGTDVNGEAIVKTTIDSVLFFQPSDNSSVKEIKTAPFAPLPHTINYYKADWPFCTVTGGGGGGS